MKSIGPSHDLATQSTRVGVSGTRTLGAPRAFRRGLICASVVGLALAGCSGHGSHGDSGAGRPDGAMDAVTPADATDEATTMDESAAIDDGALDTIPAADALATGVIARVTAPDFLNLRDSASMAGAVLAEMPCGAFVTILGGPTDVWWNVTYGMQTGWASGTYLVPASEFDPSVCPVTPDGGSTCTNQSLDVPASLISTLSVTPYVEESCVPTTFPGWPYPAQRCTYGGGIQVTVADPSPERVARWIVDSASLIPALAGLRTRDRAHYEAGLNVIATNVLNQSSRIFPLAGLVREDTTNYSFDRGVTATCSTGCYCRINSIPRPDWCHYAEVALHMGTASSCLSTYSTTSFTDAWAQHCLTNEIAAWSCDNNDHFRARAYVANEHISGMFPDPASASGSAVVSALRAEFP